MAAFRGNGRHGVEGMRNFFVVITLRLPYHGRAYYYMAYDENSIKTLDWREHIRMRRGCTSANLETEPHRTTAFTSC